MKWNQAFRDVDGMVPALPWIHCAGFIVPSLLLAVFQWNLVRNITEGNAVHRRVVCEMESANRREELRLKSEIAATSVLAAEADSVLSGIAQQSQNPLDISALDRLHLRDAGPMGGDNAMHVILLSGEVEYHAFVPALNQQEANSPLMRCKRLSLRNTGKPFYKSALRLHVDLEVVFPRLPATDGDLVPNAMQK